MLWHLERLEAVLLRAWIGEQIAANARDIEDVVHHGLPMFGRPIDGVRDYGWHSFGDAIGRHHVERFGVTGLQQQMHVRDALAELGPGLPSVLDQLNVGKSVEHGVRRAEDGIAAAFGASGRKPQLEIGFVAVGDFERGSSRAHEVLQRSRCTERADAQRAAGVERTPRKSV